MVLLAIELDDHTHYLIERYANEHEMNSVQLIQAFARFYANEVISKSKG